MTSAIDCPSPSQPLPQRQTWHWHDLPIHYQQAGDRGTPLVLIHGFGASSDHWRKNILPLAQHHRVYAIDLLGFGRSAKPVPGHPRPYTFETWGQQIIDFCQQVVGDRAVLVGNSIGCVVAMQAAVMAPYCVTHVIALDCSLRLLHDRKRATLPWYRSLPVPLFQAVLSRTAIGRIFFGRLAQPKTVKQVLRQAYGRKEAVTDELVKLLLEPAQDPGAVAVFLAFISYSQGPLPEDLLPQITVPVLLVWGEADPWEPIDLGRQLANFDCVADFISLPGIGHCPQDEDPDTVNQLIQTWVAAQTTQNTSQA